MISSQGSDYMNNYNKQLRNIIANSINNIANCFYYPIDTAILYYEQFLYELFDTNNLICKILKQYICELSYIDAYTIYSYKHKKLLTNHQDIFNYNEIANIIDNNELLATISADPNFFDHLLKSTYNFHYSNGLTKTIMVKSLNEYDKEKLNTIAPIHQYDLQSYDKKITLEDLLKNYKNQSILYDKELDINFEEAKIDTLYGFIKELSLYDINNTNEILKKIAKIDYKISLYLKDKVIDNSTINNHINIYKNDESIILDELLYNKEFLIDAIWMVIDACINHNYNEIKIDESLTNDILKLKKN